MEQQLRDLISCEKYDEAWKLFENIEDKSLIEEFLSVLDDCYDENLVKDIVSRVFLNYFIHEDKIKIKDIATHLLFYSSVYGYTSYVEFLLDKDIDIEKIIQNPIFVASQQGHLDIVKILIEKSNNNGYYILISLTQATIFNRIEIVKYLVSIKPNVNTKDAFEVSVRKNNLEITKFFVENTNVGDSLISSLLLKFPNETETTKYLRQVQDKRNV